MTADGPPIKAGGPSNFVGYGARCARTFVCSWPTKSVPPPPLRSEEHTSELQSLMRISYAVFCLKKKTNIILYSYMYFSTKQYLNHVYTLTTTSLHNTLLLNTQKATIVMLYHLQN